MKIISKSLKFPPALLLFPILLLTFVIHFTAFGQADDTMQVIGVQTTEYSVLSPDHYILGGRYYGNTDKKPFTTYFEYKKNNQDLTVSSETTIKIVRNGDADESGFFYSSPSLQLASTYYFRSVGYFNDSPSQKFYGNTLSLRTEAPFPGNIPFTAEFSGGGGNQAGIVKPYSLRSCVSPQVYFIPTDGCVTEPTCVSPKVVNKSTNTCIDPNAPAPESMSSPASTPPKVALPPREIGNPALPATTPSSDINSASLEDNGGLVPCFDGDKCGFNEFLGLINNVVKFILFKMVVPIAAIMFAYAGFQLVTSGGSTEKRGTAKKIFTNTVIGLVIAVAAFLIIKTILGILGYTGLMLLE